MTPEQVIVITVAMRGPGLDHLLLDTRPTWPEALRRCHELSLELATMYGLMREARDE